MPYTCQKCEHVLIEDCAKRQRFCPHCKAVHDINGSLIRDNEDYLSAAAPLELPGCPEILKYFKYDHLPEKLQDISRPFCDLANFINNNTPNGPEKSAGLRKLLEAKDCIVRAALD